MKDKKVKNFIDEIKEVYAGIDVLCPDKQAEEVAKDDIAWVMVAKERGHGLSRYEEAALEI